MRALIVAVVAVSQLAADFSTFPSIPPDLQVPPGAAVIMLTGSTNTTGYRIVVAPDGTAEYVTASRHARATVPSAVAQQFFADLRSATPLAALPEGSCMKSASFGTSFFVYWNHSRSPDLTCTSGIGQTIGDDAQAVASALGVHMQLHSAVRPAMPGEHHIAAPSPSPTVSGG